MKWGKTTAHQAQSPRAPRCPPPGRSCRISGCGPGTCCLSALRPQLYSFHSLPQRLPPPTLGREFQQPHSNKEVATSLEATFQEPPKLFETKKYSFFDWLPKPKAKTAKPILISV